MYAEEAEDLATGPCSQTTNTSRPLSKGWSKNAAKCVSMTLSLEDSLKLKEAQSKTRGKVSGQQMHF